MNVKIPQGFKPVSAPTEQREPKEAPKLPAISEALPTERPIPPLRPVPGNIPPASTIGSMARAIFGFCTKGAAKTAEFLLFSDEEIANNTRQSLEELETITAGAEFGQFLSAAAHNLAGALSGSLVKRGLFKEVADSETPFIEALIQSLILKGICNIARAKQQQKGGGPLMAYEVLEEAGNKLKTIVATLQERLAEAETVEEPLVAAEMVQVASLEASEALLGFLFPKGSSELPVRWGQHAIQWHLLKRVVLPGLLTDLAKATIGIEELDRLKELEANPETQILAGAAKDAGSYVAAGRQALAETEMAERVAGQIALGLSTEGQKADPDWLALQLRALSRSDHGIFDAGWKWMEKAVISLSSHTLFQLNQKRAPGDDPVGAIVQMLAGQCAQFVHDAGPQIEGSQSSEGDSAKTAALFQPLASSLVKLVAPEQPIPFVSDHLFDAEWVQQLLAEKYDSILKPVALLYAEVTAPSEVSECEKLQELPGGGFVAKRGQNIAELVRTKLPAYLVNKHRDLAAKAAQAVDKAELGGLKVAHARLEEWISNQLELLGSSSDPRVLNLWKALEGNNDRILAYSVLHIHKQQPAGGDISEKVITSLLEEIGEFMETNGHVVYERYQTLAAVNKDPAEDAEFIQLLRPLCERLFKVLGLDQTDALPVSPLLKPLLPLILVDQLPVWMAGEFRQCLAPQACMAAYKERLQGLLNPQDPAKALKEANQVVNMCVAMAPKATVALVRVLHRKIANEVGTRPAGLDHPGVALLQNGYINGAIASLLLQVLVNYLSAVRSNGTALTGVTLTEGLVGLGVIIEKHLKSEAHVLQGAATIVDPAERAQRTQEALKPLARELLELAGDNELKGEGKVPLILPFPDLFEGVWGDLKEEILPEFLAELHLDYGSKQQLAAQLAATITERTESSVIPEACRVISLWVSHFLPAHLYVDRESLATKIYALAKDHLKNAGNPEGVAVAEFLAANEEAIVQGIATEALALVKPGAPLESAAQPVLDDYLRTLLLKVFDGVTQRIEKAEDPLKRSDFLVNMGIRMLDIANKHIETILDVKEMQKVHSAYNVPYNKYAAAFGEELHPAMPTNVQAHKAVQRAVTNLDRLRKTYKKCKTEKAKEDCLRLIKREQQMLRQAKETESEERMRFLKPFADHFLDVANIHGPDDLPFPKPIREELWTKFHDSVVPDVLDSLFGLMRDPANLNKMMMSGLEALEAALDAEPEPIEPVIPEDETQRKLNESCGVLILQLLKLVPTVVLKTVFKLERVQTLSAEMVGRAVRRQLGENMTLMEVLEKGMAASGPGLHPGRWSGEGRNQVYIGEKPDGSSGYSFKFPLTDEELESEARADIVRAKAEEKLMKDKMVTIAQRVAIDVIKNFFKYPLLKFAEVWDFTVDKVFGKYATDVRDYFKQLGKKAIFQYAQILFAFLAKYTGAQFLYDQFGRGIKGATWFVFEILVHRQVGHAVKSMQMEIHQNLLYKLADELIDSLRNPDKETDLSPIAEAARRHDQLEQEEVADYIRWWRLDLERMRKRFVQSLAQNTDLSS